MGILETGQNLRSIVTRRTLLPPPDGPEHPQWAPSWQHLFQTYQPAMVRYVEGLLGRLGAADFAEPADLVQDYLARSMERGWLVEGSTEIRCFRAFLKTQLRRFVLKQLRDGQQRRDLEGLDDPAELGGAEDEVELDRGWVEVALERSLEVLRAGNGLYATIIEDLLATDGTGSADIGERVGRKPAQLVHLRHRARRRFALLFHEELRRTVRDEEAFEELCRRLEPLLP
jgi:DNA-directed RNA polymerase specialized sigma24 family protein